jgi:RNA polymerase sigma-70 factor, ECF subfamily
VNQLGSREEAEDAVQSTFLNAHRALQRGVRPEAELAWLFKIAHNVCLTRRRSSRRRGRVEAPSDLDAVQDLLPAPSREPAEELIRLPDALADMPVNQRRAILLREWKGLSYREIAAELRLSQSAVETLIFRARRTLASNLETEPERTGLLARVRQAFDASALLAALKPLLGGGAAVKATAAAVAVSGAVVVAATAPSPPPAEKRKPAIQVEKRSPASTGGVYAPTEAGTREKPAGQPRGAGLASAAGAPTEQQVSADEPSATSADAAEPSVQKAAKERSAADQPEASPPKPEHVKKPHPEQGSAPSESKSEKLAKENQRKPEATPPPAPPLEAPAAVAPPTHPLPAAESQAGRPPEDKAQGPKK